MEDERNEIITFEISRLNKFGLITLNRLFPYFFVLIFVFGAIISLTHKTTLVNFIKGVSVIFAILGVVRLASFILDKTMNVAREIAIDKRGRNFTAFVPILNRELKFNSNEVVRVYMSSDRLIFYLKDNGKVTWIRDEKSNGFLEEIIRKFEIPIEEKKQ